MHYITTSKGISVVSPKKLILDAILSGFTPKEGALETIAKFQESIYKKEFDYGTFEPFGYADPKEAYLSLGLPEEQFYMKFEQMEKSVHSLFSALLPY